jgi:2-oxoglutarate ferredoxin oxidoreductase subunit gamma
MAELKQIRVCGFGGQGVILAGVILGHAAIFDGKWVAGSSSYGAQARGGYARSDLVISDGPIVFPHVVDTDILISMAQTAYERYTAELAPDAVLLFDKGLVSPARSEDVKQVGVAATTHAIKKLHQKQAANIVMLGAAVAATGLVSREGLRSAIRGNVEERFVDVNLKAAELGFSLGEQR